MRIAESQLRNIIRETLISDLGSQRVQLREGLFDSALDTDATGEMQKAIDEFEGSAPEIPVVWGKVYSDAAKSQNVNYYMYDNGKIEVGDTNFREWSSAKSVIRQFKASLDEAIPYYTVPDGSGKFPDIDTDDLGDDDVKQALLKYAKLIEASALQKVKTIYKAALKATGNDRVKAAAICYDGAKALPYIICIALFTRYGPNLPIKTRNDVPALDAFKRYRSVDTELSQVRYAVYITISDPETDDHSQAFCTTGGKSLRGEDVVARPLCFYNADVIPDVTTVKHEIDHAIHRIFNAAFNKHVPAVDQRKDNDDGRIGDFIFEANKEVIGQLAPPALPATPETKFNMSSTPQAKPYVEQAAAFIKKNVNTGGHSEVSLAKLSFLVLGSITGRDYSGVGSTRGDTAGNGVANAYPDDDWTLGPGEIRNAVLNIFRRHRKLKKTLGAVYLTAQDVRPYLIAAVRDLNDRIIGPNVTEVCIITALGPHGSADFDKLGAVAAADQPAGEAVSDLAERIRRRWGRIAGLL